jgi:acyl-CoA dehydrogenase
VEWVTPDNAGRSASLKGTLPAMPWDFSTDPEFQSKLDWMSQFVRERIWPLETLIDELGWEGLTHAVRPLQHDVNAQGLWAAHLDPEWGVRASGRSSSD